LAQVEMALEERAAWEAAAELAAKAEMDMWARVVPMEAPAEMAELAGMP
jgi:hypothetical protein